MGTSELKGALGRNYRLMIALSVVLDVVLLFGPSAAQNLGWGSAVFFTRWLVMIVASSSLIWAYREERVSFGVRYWVTIYLIFGFTLSATLNLLGELRVWDF